MTVPRFFGLEPEQIEMLLARGITQHLTVDTAHVELLAPTGGATYEITRDPVAVVRVN